MKKLKEIIKSAKNYCLATGISIYLAAAQSAEAQDFYNGCRGPKAFQLDSYMDYKNTNLTGMLIPKLFTKNLNNSLPDLLLAIPFSITEDKVENKGINLGYLTNKIFNTNAILAFGLFKDGNDEYKVLNPQLYLTSILGNLSLDFEINTPINLNNDNKHWRTAATLGYGLDDYIRFGGSVIKERQKKHEFQGIVRIELRKNHSYWLQGYIGRKRAGIRFALNF